MYPRYWKRFICFSMWFSITTLVLKHSLPENTITLVLLVEIFKLQPTATLYKNHSALWSYPVSHQRLFSMVTTNRSVFKIQNNVFIMVSWSYTPMRDIQKVRSIFKFCCGIAVITLSCMCSEFADSLGRQ